jgi:hypothetical protein
LAVVVNNDHDRRSDERPANQPEDVAATKHREAVRRFAKYSALTVLTFLAGNRVFATTTLKRHFIERRGR